MGLFYNTFPAIIVLMGAGCYLLLFVCVVIVFVCVLSESVLLAGKDVFLLVFYSANKEPSTRINRMANLFGKILNSCPADTSVPGILSLK